MYFRFVPLFCSALVLLGSCKKDTDTPTGTSDKDILAKTLNLPDNEYEYADFALPFYFSAPPVASSDNNTVKNPITNAGATLGRVLFYDKALSVNNTIACASCHKQENSFSDPAVFSIGFEGGLTTRNSMSLANARYYNPGTFFWDERANTLEEQTLMPVQHPVEMGMDINELESRLSSKDYYKVLFRKAFGDEAINSDRISKALAQFIRSMVSFRSRYDDGLVALGHPHAPNDNLPGFTQQENQGLRLFQQHCGRCHGTEAQIINSAANDGLDVVYADNGVGAITGRAQDNGKFKVPSLRNVALTAPYMHDGRFATLAQVVEHYNSGVQDHPNLDPRLRVQPGGQPQRLGLNQQQKDAIITFLHTLTDNSFTTDAKYANPFK